MLARGVHLDAASSTPAFEVQDSTRPARQIRTRAVTATHRRCRRAASNSG
jgi:hypothetical protein